MAMNENGTLVDAKPVELQQALQATVMRLYDQNVLDGTVVEKLTYYSDGLRVKGYLARPRKAGVYPTLIWNRGGYGSDGALTDLTAYLILASTALWGYVVLATQYRGNDGGEGREDWGGDDVNDAFNLIPLAHQIPECDTSRIAVEGASRGGITTYRLLTMYSQFKCAIIHAGTTDVLALVDLRTDFRQLMMKLFGHLSAEDRAAALRQRSAVTFVTQLAKSTPILLLHGTADDKIPVEQSETMAALLAKHQIPHKLLLIPGGGHIALKDGSYREVDRYRKEWLKTYLG